MIDVIKEIAINVPGVFVFHQTKRPLIAPVGIKIENEEDDIVYLGSEIDKWSMHGDRLRIINDFNVALTEAKYEQTCKAN